MCWFSFVWFLHLSFSFLWSPFSVPPSKSHAMLSASSLLCVVCNIYFYDAFISMMLLFFILKFDWPHFKSSIAPRGWQHSSRRRRLKAWSSVDSPPYSPVFQFLRYLWGNPRFWNDGKATLIVKPHHGWGEGFHVEITTEPVTCAVKFGDSPLPTI